VTDTREQKRIEFVQVAVAHPSNKRHPTIVGLTALGVVWQFDWDDLLWKQVPAVGLF
jgi:hypothetical protein